MSAKNPSEDIPSVRDEFEQIREQFEIHERNSSSDVIFLQNKEIAFRIEREVLRFGIGKEIILISVERPGVTVKLVCREINIQGKVLTIEGVNEQESIELII